jgi:hypothetical protein
MGPQDPKDVIRDIARDLTALVGEIAVLKGDANHWLEGPEYATLKHGLGDAHAAVETALIEARRRVRLSEWRQNWGWTYPLRRSWAIGPFSGN